MQMSTARLPARRRSRGSRGHAEAANAPASVGQGAGSPESGALLIRVAMEVVNGVVGMPGPYLATNQEMTRGFA